MKNFFKMAKEKTRAYTKAQVHSITLVSNVFKTSDGRIFENEQEAAARQLQLNKRALYEEFYHNTFESMYANHDLGLINKLSRETLIGIIEQWNNYIDQKLTEII